MPMLVLMYGQVTCIHIDLYVSYSGKVWWIDLFRAFGERKFGELIDQPIAY